VSRLFLIGKMRKTARPVPEYPGYAVAGRARSISVSRVAGAASSSSLPGTLGAAHIKRPWCYNHPGRWRSLRGAEIQRSVSRGAASITKRSAPPILKRS